MLSIRFFIIEISNEHVCFIYFARDDLDFHERTKHAPEKFKSCIVFYASRVIRHEVRLAI